MRRIQRQAGHFVCVLELGVVCFLTTLGTEVVLRVFVDDPPRGLTRWAIHCSVFVGVVATLVTFGLIRDAWRRRHEDPQ